MTSSTRLAHRDPVDAVLTVAAERLRGSDAVEVAAFLRAYFRDCPPDDLAARNPVDLYGAALSHRQLGWVRPPGMPRLVLTNPGIEQVGWQSGHTVLQVVTDDMPFLVDSLSVRLTHDDVGIHLVVHPILDVRRDLDGRLLEVRPVGEGGGPPAAPWIRESWIHLELDRQPDPLRREALRDELAAVLDDVRAAVRDWEPMRTRALELARALVSEPPPPGIHPAEVAAGADLLQWMAEDHFTFLGARDYDLVTTEDGEELRPDAAGGLGLLAPDRRAARVRRLRDLPEAVRARAAEPRLLVVTKGNGRSSVHRPDRLDYVGVKRFDGDGRVVGEHRFLGLYTAVAYRSSASDIPYLRRKIDAVLAASGFPEASHNRRELWNILETFPRDELFRIDVADLTRVAVGVLNLQERRQVRAFAWRDPYERFVSSLVYVPRDRFDADTAELIAGVLVDAFGGTSAETDTWLSESVLARVHVVVQLAPGAPGDVDVAEVEPRLEAVTRWWRDDLRDALVAAHGEATGLALLTRYGDALPAAYRERYSPREAVADLGRLDALADGGFATTLTHPVDAREGEAHLKLYRSGPPVALSTVLPLLERLGVEVIDERPFEVTPAGAGTAWLYDFGLRCPAGADLRDPERSQQFEEAFGALWRGEAEADGFNRLVLAASLTVEQVAVVRAYARYLRQAGTAFGQGYIEDTLAAHPEITRRLVALFEARHDPARVEAAAPAGEGVEGIEALLDAVPSLDDDRILRALLTLVRATVRTNAFRRRPGEALALKLDPQQIPFLPAPRPQHEIWVHSPRVEGVHLRGGRVARGGIRWSDRREDFRTEVLGLMKAQMVKNAVIVPVGAKGGFVVKAPPAASEALRAEVVACYRLFIAALLDLTDNLVSGVVVPPEGVVRLDGDDPYLVVAADKGTATFSDLANGIAMERGFWLGDAFASGGSSGYDHKRMGITARGAWESVRRHFRTLGVDADTAPLTVVGVGDMSGDVFGNGMLLSPHLRLIAAFDHRHVFLDPDPDPATAFAERARLFAVARSSWDDYDRAAISAGGGVWPRSAKAIPLSSPVRASLAVEAEVLTPAELISAILRAPVDLLWNGGIGTYVKASTENNAEVGDRANDAVRVNGGDLRCRVVGEGGNLGLTQRGRIELALRGGLVNTDAIDNSAGVDASDHEVNIKILLDEVVRSGDLTVKQRDELLASMTEDVAELVLEDNHAQNLALSIARMQAGPMVDVHARYVRSLEQEGLIDRDLEALPTEKHFAERQAAGLGLTTPEFAVLLAYTKTTDVDSVLRSDLPDDPYLARELVAYFPPALRGRFDDRMAGHPLRREIVATRVVNDMVNRAGTSFDFRMTDETGASVPDITRAHLVSRDVFALAEQWAEVDELAAGLDPAVPIELFLDLRRTVERGVQWLLRNRRPPIDLAGTVAAFGPGIAALAEHLPDLVRGGEAEAVRAREARLLAAGVPSSLARRASAWPHLHTGFDVVEVARARGREPEDVAAVWWALVEHLGLGWLRDRIGELPRNDRWQAHARGALRDDLLAEVRGITDDALRGGDVFTSVDDLLARWEAANARVIERVRQVFADVRASGRSDLTTLSVALRQVRNLRTAGVSTA